MQLHIQHAGEQRKEKNIPSSFFLLNLSASWCERPSAPFVCGEELMRSATCPPPSAGSGRLADFIARPKSMCEWNKRRTDKVHTLPCVTQPLSPGPRRTHSSAHAGRVGGHLPNLPAARTLRLLLPRVDVFVFVLSLQSDLNAFEFLHDLWKCPSLMPELEGVRGVRRVSPLQGLFMS